MKYLIISKAFNNTSTFKTILYNIWSRLEVVEQLDHPLCSQWLDNTQSQVNWSYPFLTMQLLANLLGIPLLKLLMEKVFGGLVDADVHWLQSVCKVGRDHI